MSTSGLLSVSPMLTVPPPASSLRDGGTPRPSTQQRIYVQTKAPSAGSPVLCSGPCPSSTTSLGWQRQRPQLAFAKQL